MTESMHIVITGGAGFLGSHMTERLLAFGSRVTCFDNLLTSSLDNIQPFLKQDAYRFHERSSTNDFNMLKNESVDAVLHFASPASPVDYGAFPIETLQVGSIGTQQTLELAHQNEARYLLTSTSEVYGDPLVHPQTETYFGNVNPVGPRSVYDEAKRYAEALTTAYRFTYDLDIRIARVFNTYGPRMRKNDGRVVSNFIVQALSGEDITVYGDGTQTRSFSYVDDTIDGLLLFLSNDWNSKDASGPLNIGNPEEYSINDIAKTILKLTNSTSQIRYDPLPVDDPKQRRPDITKAKKHLDWQPQINLEQGLKKTIEYFQSVGIQQEMSLPT
jgi:dTDP-glucose 4,6-dehydratase